MFLGFLVVTGLLLLFILIYITRFSNSTRNTMDSNEEKFPLRLYKKKGTTKTGYSGVVSFYELEHSNIQQDQSLLYRDRRLPDRIAVKKIKVKDSYTKVVLRREKELFLALCDSDGDGCKNIVQYYAFEWEEGSKEAATIVMEEANMDLRSFLKAKGALKFEVAIDFFEQMTSGLRFLHGMNTAHRDLKPENILLFWENGDEQNITLKLCDFGLVKQLDSKETRTHSNVGTPDYLAPELKGPLETFRGNPEASDIFVLGLIFIELLSRERYLFDRRNFHQIAKSRDLPVHLILSMLSFDWHYRPTAETVLERVRFLKINGLFGYEGSKGRINAEDCDHVFVDVLRNAESAFGVVEVPHIRHKMPRHLVLNGIRHEFSKLQGLFMFVTSPLESEDFVERDFQAASKNACSVLNAIRPVCIGNLREFGSILRTHRVIKLFNELGPRRRNIRFYAILVPMATGTAINLEEELLDKYYFLFNKRNQLSDADFDLRAPSILFEEDDHGEAQAVEAADAID